MLKDEIWKKKIGSGAHWKDKMTIPNAPQLVNRAKEGGSKPRALNKPVDITESILGHTASNSSFKRHQNYPQTLKAHEFESKQSQAKLLLQKKNERERDLLKIDEKMDFDQAQWAIHQHILNLV